MSTEQDLEKKMTVESKASIAARDADARKLEEMGECANRAVANVD